MTTSELREVMPGEIWESRHGKHEGLKVRIEKDRGQSVKVKVMRTPGIDHDMIGRYWTVPKDIFFVRYVPVVERQVVSEKLPTVDEVIQQQLRRNEEAKRQEKLQAAIAGVKMAVETVKAERQNGVTEVQTAAPLDRAALAARNFHTQEARDKRAATLQARADSLTQEEITEMRRLFASGESIGEIARAYHLDASHTSVIVQSARPKSLGPEVAAAPEQSTVVKQRVPHPQTVESRALISDGTKRAIERKFQSLTPEVKAQIVQMRLDGVSYFVIMRHFGVINGVITKVLHEAGYTSLGKNSKYRLQPQPEAQREAHIKLVPISTATESIERTKVADTRIYKAHVVISVPKETYVDVEAGSLADAIQLAEAMPGVSHVFGVREERETANSSRSNLERK